MTVSATAFAPGLPLISPRHIISGIAFPEDILTQTWFAVFGIFVAFNTIIYLGLTVAKFIPWPNPVHPGTVRHVIPGPIEERSAMRTPRSTVAPAVSDPESALRLQTARETIPLALGLTGALAVISGFINTLLYFDDNGPIVLVGAAFGFLFILLSQILSRISISDRAMIWIWTVMLLLLVVETSWRAEVLDSAVILGYAVIALIVIAPITLSWSAGITAAVAGLIPIVMSGYSVSLVDTVSWFIAAVTASLASLVLLQLRMAALRQITFEQQRANTLVTTDALTGTFSRTGLLTLAPSLAAAAEKAQDDVCVIVCDVQGMTSVNADYGISYGDDVLAATARALRACLDADAIIGRWDGDQFIAVQLGGSAELSDITYRVDQALAASGVALGKRPLAVQIGVACADPAKATFEALIHEAAAALAGAPNSQAPAPGLEPGTL